MLKALYFSAGLASAVLACSSSSSTTPAGESQTSVSGNVGGAAFEPSSAVFVSIGTPSILHVAISTKPDFCANVGDGNSSELDLAIPFSGSAVGTYPLTAALSDNGPYAAYGIYGDGTATTFNVQTGSITITSSTSDTLAGTFDITFASGEGESGASSPGGELTGTFSASNCPALGASFQ